MNSQLFKALKSQRGMSLVMVLTSAVIVAIISITSIKMFSGLFRSSRRAQQLAEMRSSVNIVESSLANSDICRCNLTPETPARTFAALSASTTDFALNDIKMFSDTCTPGATLMEKTSVAPPSGVWIKDLHLREFFRIDDNNYQATLIITGDKVLDHSSSTPTEKSIRILFATTTNGGTVTLNRCAAASAARGVAETAPASKYLVPKWTSNTSITIPAGKILSDDDTEDMVIDEKVVSISATGANALDTGVVAVLTWYSVWVIWGSAGSAGLLSTSATSPNLPTGYSKKRRIGWISTNALGQIVRFSVRTSAGGHYFSQGLQGLVSPPSTTATNLVTFNNSIPPNIEWARVWLRVYDGQLIGNCFVHAGHGDNPGVSAFYAQVWTGNGAVAHSAHSDSISGEVKVFIDTTGNRQLNVWYTNNPTVRSVAVMGWFDGQ